MWSIVQTKSDAEPWWFLEGWREDILHEWTYTDKKEAFACYKDKTSQMAIIYPNCRVKRGTQAAYWCESELLFCDSCDEDLQLYHGFLILKNGIPYTKDHMTEEDRAFFEGLFPANKKTEA